MSTADFNAFLDESNEEARSLLAEIGMLRTQ
jgi:hypothetical protein